MKTILRVGVLLVLALVTLTSCSTTGIPPRTSSEDCLVLIPTVMINPDKVQAIRVFVLWFSDPLESREVGQKPIDFLALLVPNDQVQLKLVTSAVRGAGSTGDATTDAVNLPLPYVPGKVLVWEKCFVQGVKRAGFQSTTASFGIEATPADLKAEVLRLFDATPQAADWKE